MSVQAKKIQKKARNTLLTDVLDFPGDRKALKEELKRRLVIDPPQTGTVPNSNPAITYNRINIGIRNPDGTEGDLVVPLDRSFSFGVSESKAPDTGILNGYSMVISMYDRDGATERQARSVMFIEVLAEILIEHCLTEETKDALGKYDLEAALLKKLNPLYYKTEKGKRVEGASPTFYPKLMWYKAGKDKNGKDKPASMGTTFYSEDDVDENGEQVTVDPLEFIGVKCYITPAIKFENIFLGSKNNLQAKIYEAEVKAVETGKKRLLKVAATRAPSVIISGSNPLLQKGPGGKDEVKEPGVSSKLDENRVSDYTVSSHAEDDQLQASDDEGEKKKKIIKKKIAAPRK